MEQGQRQPQKQKKEEDVLRSRRKGEKKQFEWRNCLCVRSVAAISCRRRGGMKKGKKNVKKGKKCRHPARSSSCLTQSFEVRRHFHVKFSFFEFGFCYDVVSHIKTITSKIYRQLTSTLPFFFAEALGVFVCALPKLFIRWRSSLSCDNGSTPGMVTSLSCDTGSTC